MILLLGRCGLERLAEPLRALTGGPVAVGGWTQTELADRLAPELVYVDLFDWDRLAPIVSAALRGDTHPVDTSEIRPVVASLSRHTVVYRSLRRPLADAFGLATELPLALDALASVLAGQKVLDVAALWARHGLVPDEAAHGMGHGEAAELTRAAEIEARALHALWWARTRGPVKCVVLDLDDTLIHGLVADDGFAAANPAWLPEGETARASAVEGWWRLRRGLHEALRVLQRRGIVLALATRNDPETVRRRWRKRPVEPSADTGMYQRFYADAGPEAFVAHAQVLDRVALGPEDMVCIEAGFGPKSEMCRRIADRLGLGLDALALVDDSPYEREEVRRNAPEVWVPEVTDLRAELVHGARFTVWERTGVDREASYRSRASIPAGGAVEDFLRSLAIVVRVRAATAEDLPRVRELLQRTHQLDLTGARPTLLGADGVLVAACRDRIADHGLVAAGVFVEDRLEAWVCSCRVLPHRVAGTILGEMLARHPGAHAERVATDRNAATIGLLDEARGGPAPWVRVE